MLKIEVLGTGCAKCRKLTENVERAARELGLSCQIEKVTQISAIVERGVMMTPALAIDGRVESVGSVLDVAALKRLLERHAGSTPPAGGRQP